MPDFSQLTERQREIYDHIRHLIETRGYGPTVRDIGDHFHIQSPNGVMCHLKALEKKGQIIRKEGKARAIDWSIIIPVRRLSFPFSATSPVGALNIQAEPNDERLNFGDLFCNPENFAQRYAASR